MTSRRPLVPFFERSFGGTLEAVIAGSLLVGLILAFIPLGYKASLVNFTYGARGLDPVAKAEAKWLLAVWVAGMFAWEIAFRGLLLRFLLKKFSWQKAFLIHLAVLNAVVIPYFFTKALQMEDMGPLRFFLEENLVECFWALFFLRTGSLFGITVLHGFYNFIRFHVINDVSGPYETYFFYSAASDHFYWAMIACAFLAAVIQLFIGEHWGMRESRD